MQLSFGEPSDGAIVSFAFISAVYLVASLMALVFAPRNVKLLAAGIITAVAAIGYAGLVSGAAAMVATSLMKIAVLLILGGLGMRLLDVPAQTGNGGGSAT